MRFGLSGAGAGSGLRLRLRMALLWLCFACAGESRVWEIHVYLHNVQPPPKLFFFLGLAMPGSRRPRRLTGAPPEVSRL